MKKIIVMLLAVCMMFTVAFAETSETATEMNWSEIEEMAADLLNGEFYELTDLGLKVYVPESLTYTEDEDYVALFLSEDQASGFMVLLDSASADTLEGVAALMTAGGAEGLDYVIINGLPAIAYSFDGVNYVNFLTDAGNIIAFAAPASEDFDTTFGMIVASIQAIE